MNSTACLNVILKKIQENVRVFDNTSDLQKLVTLLFRLSSEVMQNSLSSSLLKNVIIAVKQLYEKNIIGNDDYKLFMRNVNNFYKSQSICESYKLEILSCFSPAVELELLSLLRLCSNVSNINELVDVRSAVESSILVKACQKNVNIIQKITNILKKVFTLSEGNPIVCYLTFCFCSSVEFSLYNPYLLSKEFSGLDALFQFPYHLLTVEDGKLLIKHLIKLCFETEKMNLCTKNDIIFCTAVFPVCYRKMLDLCRQNTYILDFLTFLCNDNTDFLECMIFAQKNPIWKCLC